MNLRTVQIPLLPLLLMVSACAPAAPPTPSASAASAALVPASVPVSGAQPASTSQQKEKPEWLKQWFAIEEAMGAQCMESGSDGMEETLFLDASCYGRLPEHLSQFIRQIPVSHPFLDEQRKKMLLQRARQYKAISGLGKQPDFLVYTEGFGSFWIRSFEGPDPSTTVYLVHGPTCEGDYPNQRCLPESARMRNFRLYRSHNGGTPQDVTSELAPPAPRMNAAERRRYGIYLRPKGLARDGDIKLDVSRLVYTPVLRWTVRPAHDEREDYYHPPKSIPDTDPRVYKEYYSPDLHGNRNNIHYGFLVWNGKRFELQEKVPTNLWPCRIDWHDYTPDNRCGEGYDSYDSRMDRYLIQPTSQNSTSRSAAP